MQPIYQTTFCPGCNRDIISTNYELHSLRCRGPSTLKDHIVMGRIFQFSKVRRAIQQKERRQEEEQPKCIWCGDKLINMTMQEHAKECLHKPYKCEYCAQEYPQILIQQHYEFCQAKKETEDLIKQMGDQVEQQGQAMQIPQSPRERPATGRSRRPPSAARPGSRSRMEEFPEFIRSVLSRIHPARPSSAVSRNSDNDYQQQEDIPEQIEDQQQEPQEQQQGDDLPAVLERLSGMFDYLVSNIAGGPDSDQPLDAQHLEKLPEALYKRRPTRPNQEEQQCSICFCQLEQGEKVTTLPCFHMYHSQCIIKWLGVNGRCPVCKASVKAMEK